MTRGGRSPVVAFASIFLAFLIISPSSEGANPPNSKADPLYAPNHPNVTFLTDKNYDQTLEANKDKPWLIEFYHPFCPHCIHFVPAYTEIAAFYKERGDIHIGAISCMDNKKCRRVAIKGFPTLMALNFDDRHPATENKRIVGSHTVQEVKDYVEEVRTEIQVNKTGTQPPTKATSALSKEAKPGEQARTEIWEETTLPMNKTSRIQDAASAFIFGLKQGVFIGKEVLSEAELDALKGWVRMVSRTFPGELNRLVIHKLHIMLQEIELLDFDTWDAIVREWQEKSIVEFRIHESKRDYSKLQVEDMPEWQRLDNLFQGEGVAYQACAKYTCGQWTMFHMLTMNPPGERDPQLLTSVVANIRRFMTHFFGCVQCRDHFLEKNQEDKVKMIADSSTKEMSLKTWLWTTHNDVNERLRHPQWPKPDACPDCRLNGNWRFGKVYKYLDDMYAYKEVEVPLVTEAPETTVPALRQEEKTPLPMEEVEDTAKSYRTNAAASANTMNLNAGENEMDVSVFGWYLLPLVAVAGYLAYVSRKRKNAAKYHHVGTE